LADHNYAPKTLEQLVAHPKLQSTQFGSIVQAAIVLTGAGFAHPAQEPTQQAMTKCAALNRYLCERARSSGNVTFLASPVCSIGVPANQFHQLFMLAAYNGIEAPKDQAAFVWDVMNAQGRRLVKDGKTLESPEQNIEEITRQAIEFVDKRLPILRGLGVALA
jgi:hypothetical protein